MCTGSGTPPHSHRHEDEVFSRVSGRFEIFDGRIGLRYLKRAWSSLPLEAFTVFGTAVRAMARSSLFVQAAPSISFSRDFPGTRCQMTCKRLLTTPRRLGSFIRLCLHRRPCPSAQRGLQCMKGTAKSGRQAVTRDSSGKRSQSSGRPSNQLAVVPMEQLMRDLPIIFNLE